MPYIVTTKRPDDADDMRVTYRCAAATLEEAREAVAGYCDDPPEWPGDGRWHVAAAVARALTDSGGTIGPLPDGTVIEVEPMVNEFGRPDVRGYLRGWHFPASMDEAEIIAAYNKEAPTL